MLCDIETDILLGNALTVSLYNYLIFGGFNMASCAKVAVGRRLGIEEPQLMKIMRATLHTHNEWFKLQMGKDHFEGLLRINSLREVGIPVLGDLACNSTGDACAQGSSQISSSTTQLQEDGSSPTPTSSTDLGCDENAILKVMVSSAYLHFLS